MQISPVQRWCMRGVHEEKQQIVWYTERPMSHSVEDMRPARLWRLMPLDLRVSAASAFWEDEQAALEQAEAVALIARQIKFRPKSVLTLAGRQEGQAPGRPRAGVRPAGGPPGDRLSPRAPAADDGRVSRRPRHCARRRPDQGRVAGQARRRDARRRASKTLAAAYPKADVARYFWTLLWQDPETWGGLQGPARTQPRVAASSETHRGAVRHSTSSSAATGASRGSSRAGAATRRETTRCRRRSRRPWPSAD